MCSFEAPDICGYTQDHDTDNFDWSRSNGPTASISTGPAADHTYGTLFGKVPLFLQCIFVFIPSIECELYFLASHSSQVTNQCAKEAPLTCAYVP